MLCGLYGKSLRGEVMTQEALELALEHGSFPQGSGVIRAIKEALAQLKQEHDNSATHLAHCYQGEYPVCKYGDENCPATPKVKTQPEQEPVVWELGVVNGVVTRRPIAPPQRTWVGLTDEQIDACWNKDLWKEKQPHHIFAKAIEAKLKEKNT